MGLCASTIKNKLIMKRIFYILGVAGVSLSIASCGKILAKNIIASGTVVSKDCSIEKFDGIVTNGMCDVIYHQTNGEQRVTLYASDNVIDYVDVHVVNGDLVVELKDGYKVFGEERLELVVSSGVIKRATVNGGADMDLNGVSSEESMALNINGDGDIEMHHFSLPSLSATVHGSGDFDLSGRCREANYEVTGSGDVDADKVKAEDVKVVIVGNGEVDCYADKTLDVKVQGRGLVSYRGNPQLTGDLNKVRRDD